MSSSFENGYLRGRIAGISFAEEENRSRIDRLMASEANALKRVAELESCNEALLDRISDLEQAINESDASFINRYREGYKAALDGAQKAICELRGAK